MNKSQAQPGHLPLFFSPVKAGFPSPAEDYIEKSLDFNEYLVSHPAATFCLRVSGDSMYGAGIFPGDIIIVDRAIAPSRGSIIVAAVDGELTVKRLLYKNGRTVLSPENPAYPDIVIAHESECSIWGVVTYVIHRPQ